MAEEKSKGLNAIPPLYLPRGELVRKHIEQELYRGGTLLEKTDISPEEEERVEEHETAVRFAA